MLAAVFSPLIKHEHSLMTLVVLHEMSIVKAMAVVHSRHSEIQDEDNYHHRLVPGLEPFLPEAGVDSLDQVEDALPILEPHDVERQVAAHLGPDEHHALHRCQSAH